MLVIAVEALAQHLVGIAHDEKGGGVGLLYRRFRATICFCLKAHMSTSFASPDQARPPGGW